MDKLTRLVEKESGDNPLIFLDTGAIIEFENWFLAWRKMQQGGSVSDFYRPLTSRYSVLVPETVMAEVCTHKKYRINRRFEISEETCEFIGEFHKDYCDILKKVVSASRPYSDVADAVLKAGEIARILRARDNRKKANKPGLSDADKEVLGAAAWLRYCSLEGRSPITSTFLFGNDSLLVSAARIMCDTHHWSIKEEFGTFGYSGINAIDIKYF